jgi:hypothetical protein
MFQAPGAAEPGEDTAPGKVSKRKRGKVNGSARPPKANGRKDGDKTPAVKQPKVVADKLDYLVKLEHAAQMKRVEADEAVTKVAEDSGYLSSSVKKLVKAKAGEKFEEKHREVEQQAELFDEAGK